jgi:uncharacterized SAM-binding protein YcdF (DUF218 family)
MNNYLIWGLFAPATWLFWTLLIQALLRRSDWPKLANTVMLIGVLLSYIVVTPAGSQLLIHPLESRYPALVQMPKKVDGIILLAGSESLRTWTPARGLQVSAHGDRYTKTIELANRYPRAKVLFTGSPMVDGVQDAQQAEQFLRPILGNRLQLIKTSTDTCGNATEAAKSKLIQRPERWLLVTSAAHMRRAMVCFEAASLPVVPAPSDFRAPIDLAWPKKLASYVPSPSALEASSFALHEWAGLLWYEWTGRIPSGSIRRQDGN